MRLLLLILCIGFLQTNAQQILPIDKDLNSIIENEKRAFARLGGNGNADLLTFASTNFDVKYYRCEWEVNPAIRYITGKVTIYFTITKATNNIVLDLLNNSYPHGFKLSSMKSYCLQYKEPDYTCVILKKNMELNNYQIKSKLSLGIENFISKLT